MNNRSVDEARDTSPVPPAEILRAYLFTYTVDRLGRPASVTARSLAFEALDALENRAGL
jgi:hypothetical protein